MARALIADPDMPRKLLGGRAADIRPCVACNEDCRAFDPVLLCSVNPELGPPGADRRPAAPLVVRRAAEPAGGRVAIVGAGPAGLECALTLAGRREVVLFDARDAHRRPARRRGRGAAIAAGGARCWTSTRRRSSGRTASSCGWARRCARTTSPASTRW